MVSPKKATKAETEDKTPETVFTRELTTAEKFYIDNHYEAINVDEIASDLGVPVDVVQSRVASLKDETVKREPTMFERSLAKKKHGTAGAVIMTEGASEQIDEAYKQVEQITPKYVYRPRNNNKS